MNVLFIGGTGYISSACTDLAVKRGYRVTLLNRSQRRTIAGTEQLTVDISDVAAAASALANHHWDVVVDFVAFTREHIEQRIALFRGKVGQYFFISSASAYQKPVMKTPITESTPLVNPFWQYSRDKIAAEERLLRALRDEAFPSVIIRPSLTYGDMIVPLAVNSWQKSYTIIDRMRRGKPVIVPGDGLTLWTITHNTDFAKGLVGLFGQERAIGHAFHITSDEALTWDQYYLLTARAAGVQKPKLVHIASDFIAACLPEMTGSLLGDKSYTAIFDNSKIRSFVPEFQATTSYAEGIARTIAWLDADEKRRDIDQKENADWDRLIAAYERGLDQARREFGS
ncbi:MAG: NAD-dependent epimerase/dehydratase family protein [Nibricoccus sp.]